MIRMYVIKSTDWSVFFCICWHVRIHCGEEQNNSAFVGYVLQRKKYRVVWSSSTVNGDSSDV